MKYPLAPAGTRYEETTVNPVWMSPDEFLSRVRPLTMDDESIDCLNALKEHILSGLNLDPLCIYADGSEDGRHRAYAAKQLNIKLVPVIIHRENIMKTNFTSKAKEMNIQKFSIKGNRWFQKSYGSTYHKAHISAMIDDMWVDVGSSEMEYGYDEMYLVTGGQWLIDNGFIEAESGYEFAKRSFRDENSIEHYAVDVKRQRDL